MKNPTKSTFYPLILLIIFFGGCGNNLEPATFDGIVHFTEIQDQSDKIADIINKSTLIPLAIDQILSDDDLLIKATPNAYYIYSFLLQQLFWTDKSGHFQGYIGKSGDGLGEYQEVYDIAPDPLKQRIYVLAAGGKILVYDLEGVFMQSTQSEIVGFSLCADNETWLLYSGNEILNAKPYSLWEISPEGKAIKYFLEITPDNPNLPVIVNSPVFESNAAGSFLTPNFSHTTYYLKNGVPMPTFTFDFGDMAMPKDLPKDDLVQKFLALQKNDYYYLKRYAETPDRQLALFSMGRHFRTNEEDHLLVFYRKNKNEFASFQFKHEKLNIPYAFSDQGELLYVLMGHELEAAKSELTARSVTLDPSWQQDAVEEEGLYVVLMSVH